MTSFQIKKGGESAYLQLYRQLKQAISDGLYPPGSRLPSKRQLASELGISVVTAQHALELLADEGRAEARQRSGFYALTQGPAVPPASLEQMRLPPSVPEDFPFSTLAKIMRRTLLDKGERILAKSPPCGTAELRGAIRQYLARSRGMTPDEEQIVVGAGAEYLYALLVQLLGRDGLFALEEPSYDKIRRVYESSGARCTGLKMGADGIDSAALAGCGAKVLHVTPYRSFPSGVTASAAKRAEYAEWAADRGAYIVEDDYDSELAAQAGAPETVYSLLPGRVIYLGTFSKTVAPSFRTAYMVLPPELAREYREKLGFYSCSVPVYDQFVLAEFIRSGEFERYINRRRRRMKNENR